MFKSVFLTSKVFCGAFMDSVSMFYSMLFFFNMFWSLQLGMLEAVHVKTLWFTIKFTYMAYMAILSYALSVDDLQMSSV